MSYFKAKMHQIRFLPQTPLGSLQRFLKPRSWIKRVLFLGEGTGRKKERVGKWVREGRGKGEWKGVRGRGNSNPDVPLHLPLPKF